MDFDSLDRSLREPMQDFRLDADQHLMVSDYSNLVRVFGL